MASARPNLARRPFVDSRPANLAAALLLAVVAVLTVVSVRTVRDYLVGSRASRDAVVSLRAEIGRLEASRREADAKLARFDLAGLRAGAEEANELARLRSFSWSRFLTRLERTLPNDVRVVSISLTKKEGRAEAGAAASPREEAFREGLALVARDRDALPALLRAFYASPWFDAPVPLSEAGGDQGAFDGRSLTLEVLYRDRQVKR